jgi:phenylalanyl-tRNA synthetase beta chain
MKVPLNFANSISNVDILKNGIDEVINKVGAQLGAIEDVEFWNKKYDKAVVVKVVSCQKHPNADKLTVCVVDDGSVTTGVERNAEGFVQVVCGAPNVSTGIFAVWLPPTSTVPSTYGTKEEFVLASRELRGIISNGMLAAPDELALGDDHDGLLLLDSANPGMPFAEYAKLNEVILDLENKMFTHRPDCFGVLGVARELAGIQNMQFISPSWYLDTPKFNEINESLPINVSVETNLVPRLMAVSMKNVKITESSDEIKSILNFCGIKTINNVVDITNYLMQLTGQPLHAYDYDKLLAQEKADKASIVARLSRKGESLKLLNGKTLELKDDNTVMISTLKNAVGVGGVMGGSDTEVDENTVNIILECATFDMYNIRKTSMKYGLFTDAVTRFNKGQSPLQNDRILAKAIEMVNELAGGVQASNVVDIKNDSVVAKTNIQVDTNFINMRLGSSLSPQEIVDLLTNVEFSVDISGETLDIKIPFWRQDIELPEDIVEEVGRLYGFDKLPVALPQSPASPSIIEPQIVLKNLLCQILSSAGANEVLTYSFVHGDIINKAGQKPDDSYKLSNALSPELQYYRQSLLPSLLDKINQNVRSDYARPSSNEFALFELNKVHIKGSMDKVEATVPAEFNHLAFVIAADEKTASNKYKNDPYYHTIKYLNFVLSSLNTKYKIVNLEDTNLNEDISKNIELFDQNRVGVILINDLPLGLIGEFSSSVTKNFKLPSYCAGFEINIDNLSKQQPTYINVPKFPKIQQDITVSVGPDTPFSQVKNALESQLSEFTDNGYYIVMDYPSIFKPENSATKNISFKVWISYKDGTLKADEVNTLLDKAILDAGLKRV